MFDVYRIIVYCFVSYWVGEGVATGIVLYCTVRGVYTRVEVWLDQRMDGWDGMGWDEEEEDYCT